MVGQQLGDYSITGKLGEGGMGSVYAARHVRRGVPAAIKVLLPELSSNPEMVARFFDEARATRAIRHPGIVEIYELGHDASGNAYLAMELLRGHSLARRMARGPAPVAEALRIARQIAAALQAAHEAGVVHRDLKPDNVFVSEAGGDLGIKLLDFGIAKRVGVDLARTLPGSLVGTPRYMAPEQCRGDAVDHRADIYALGCILFELLTGRPLFEGTRDCDFLLAHVHATPPAPSRFAPAVPPAIDALVLRLLEKDPAARPASAREVFIDLELALAHAQRPRIGRGTAPLPAFASAAPAPALETPARSRAARAAARMALPPGIPAPPLPRVATEAVTRIGRPPGRRPAPRTVSACRSWGWRGLGFVAGALALALAASGL